MKEYRLPNYNVDLENISKILEIIAKEIEPEALISLEEFARTYGSKHRNIDALIRFRELKATIATLRSVAYSLSKECFDEYEQNDISADRFFESAS